MSFNGAGSTIPGGIINPDGTVDHKANKKTIITDPDVLQQKQNATYLIQQKTGAPTNADEGIELNNSNLANIQRGNVKKNIASKAG